MGDNLKTTTTEAASSSAVCNNPLLDAIEQLEQSSDDAIAKKCKELEDLQKACLNVPLNKPLFNKENVSPSILEQQRSLPISKVKDELIEAIRTNQMVIVVGDTGSGKSTQIPQYLVEAGLHGGGKIAVTQPRRVAAKSLATRVAEECGVELGTTVGYAVRFDKKISGETVIKFMTDGLLVKECTSDTNLDTYSVIIIDEAHERTKDTDVCFGILKLAASKRPDLKIIISSATLDEDKFKKYFNNAPIFKVGGKTHPVDIIYKTPAQDDYMQEAANVIMSISSSESKGDILVFLCSRDEIEKLRMKLSKSTENLHVVPCYGALPFEEQQKIFKEAPESHRKVVLATNIAETSITVKGIVYVIDCGYFKQTEYNSRTGISSLVKKRITKCQATQRKGRAGRTQSGQCYRLYSEKDFDSMEDSIKPELERCNVESVILDIMAMGISRPLDFDFMDKPPQDVCEKAMKLLIELQAVDENRELTSLGKRMSELPLEPQLAKIVIESAKLGCMKDVVKIVAMLNAQYQNMFVGDEKNREASRARLNLLSEDGDLLVLLKIFDLWVVFNYSKEWCEDMNLSYHTFCEADEIRQQLEGILYKHGISTEIDKSPSTPADLSANIRKSFTAGYFRQIARRTGRGFEYESLGHEDKQSVCIDRTSSLFQSCPQWLIYHEVMKPSKTYMRGVTPVKLSWIKEYAPEFGERLQKLDDLCTSLYKIRREGEIMSGK